MVLNPLQILRRLRPSRTLSLTPTLPLILAFHAVRSYARHANPYRPSKPRASGRSEIQAAVAGKWRLELVTPLGKRNSIVNLKPAGRVLTGRQSAEGNSVEIFDGIIDGSEVAWKVSITAPMPLTLAFEGTVEGDVISGEMDAGPIGCFPFRGKRA